MLRHQRENDNVACINVVHVHVCTHKGHVYTLLRYERVSDTYAVKIK